jgi:hypothetical protein
MPAGTRILTRPVVRYRPVYRREAVTIRSQPTTVDNVVTDTVSEVQTINQTVTAVRTTPSPPETVTVTGPTQTVTITVPMITVTVKLP